MIAIDIFDEGHDPEAPAGGVYVACFKEATAALLDAQAASVVRTLARARERATALVAEHREAILALARIAYAERRLSDARVDEAMREAGVPIPARRRSFR